MNKVLFIFFFLSSIAFSQSKLELTYKVKSYGKPLEFDSTIKPEILPYLISMEKELEDLTFTLQIKGNESLWFLNNRDKFPTSHMGQSFAGNTSYYFDANAQEYLTQENFFSNLFLISKKPKKINWELVDETKTILGYECKKAIYKETKEIKGENKEFITEAWYCPKLSYKIGPKDFGGLNGLILELTDKRRQFYCTEILEGAKTSLFILEKPNKGKPIKEEEFLEEMRKIAIQKGMPHD
ncbi:GLPGLI family protein [Flavobacterium sp. j3]|uniref:GLPGLI family protein n=1 Tax=Flavobacterium aureirubrum TaxID=3133147 RepID=A0ABU9N3P9_9FLAO